MPKTFASPKRPGATYTRLVAHPFVLLVTLLGVLTLASGGHALLRPAAEAAARQAKFTPVKLSGKPVKTVGAMVYNFVSSDANPTSSSIVVGEKDVKLLLEEQKRIELQAKLHPSLLALIDRLKDKTAKSGAEEVKFVPRW